MNSNQKFHKTVYRVVVLTDDGPLPEGMDLGSIAYTISEGGAAGGLFLESSEPLTKEQMKESIKEIGYVKDVFMFGDDDENS